MKALSALILCSAAVFGAPTAAAYTMLADTLLGSEVYPGTVHTLQVSVPDGYSSATPAPLYLGLDGVLCNAPAVLDSLAAAGVIAPTVGIYLQPGVIRDSDGHVVRYNRSNEFDATDARFATFLANEVLPAVERMLTPAGEPIVLSPDPSQRTIFGLSSGGIAAFMAAWHRPDLFGKIFSGCGTFVAMRGGNDVQAIVRKHEPRPLKIFLQDGYDDVWNGIFGHWYEANRMLASALEFAGYDCAFDWAEGGHSVRRANAIFPQVMTWLADSTTTPSTTQNNFLAPLLDGTGEWMPSAPIASMARSEAVYPDSSLVAVAMPEQADLWQYIVAPDSSRRYGQPFYRLHSYTARPVAVADLCFDAAGNLWVLTDAGIQVCDQNGRVRGIIALPLDFSADTLIIEEGRVVVSGPTGTIQRHLNVSPPIPGRRPASQGQG